MNYAHIHLVLSHIPVLGIVFGLLVAAYGFIRKSDEVKQTALGIFILAALMTIPVYFTGEPAEEIVEHLAGVSEAVIDQHEDAGFIALGLMAITGVLALFNLILSGRSYFQRFMFITLLSAIFTGGSILWTANLGGKIRHSEIRDNGEQSTRTEKAAESDHEREHEDEDEDDEDEDDH